MPIKRRHLSNPQDLNRYSYVANNPLRFIDPDGKEKIEIVVNTFIPQTSAAGFKGDGRNVGEPGTYRTQQKIVIETDPSKNNGNPLVSYTRDTGMTHATVIGVKIIGTKPITASPIILVTTEAKASGDTLKATASQDAKTGVVTVRVSGNEGNPLAPMAPAITFDLNIAIRSDGPNGNATVTVTGNHDGFPAYEVIATRPEAENNSSTVIYGYDPRTIGKGIGSLFPPMDESANKPPVTIDPKKRKEQ